MKQVSCVNAKKGLVVLMLNTARQMIITLLIDLHLKMSLPLPCR